jgi:O-glycosyl hydrolase
VRIEIQNQNPDLKPIAFQNPDDEIIIVLWNSSGDQEAFNLASGKRKSEIVLPANSINTIVLEK